MDNKVKLELKLPENKEIEYNGVKIEIKPFLSLPHQVFLINRYVEEYFVNNKNMVGGSECDYIGAECSLKNYILQGCTNVDVEGFDNDLYADDSLWGKIYKEIINYYSFRGNLYAVIQEIKEQKEIKSSLGEVISNLIDKIIPILDEIKDITPEQIKELQDKSSQLMKDLQESAVIQDSQRGVQ
jgi:hypothetical protein